MFFPKRQGARLYVLLNDTLVQGMSLSNLILRLSAYKSDTYIIDIPGANSAYFILKDSCCSPLADSVLLTVPFRGLLDAVSMNLGK